MAGAAGIEENPGAPGWISATLNAEGQWALRKWVPYVLGLMMLFDSWDSVAIGYVMPSLMADWKLNPALAGTLASAGFGGQFLGALTCGALAERFGRLPVLKPLVIVMCLLAVACGLTQSYDQLLLVRFVQGLTIGGALPVAISYINEIAPAKTRGRFFGTFQFLMLAGFFLSGQAAVFVVPNLGWRAMFMLGAIPLLLVPFLYVLPESPRWLAARGRADEARTGLEKLGGQPGEPSGDVPPAPAQDRPGVALLFSDRLRLQTVVTGLLWFCTATVSFGLLTWVPSLYVKVFNIPIKDSLKYSAIAAGIIFFVPLVFRFIIDKVGRRRLAIVGAAVSGGSLITLPFVDPTNTSLVVTLVIIGSVAGSFGSIVLWPYTAEIYETRVRALALGASSSLARAASMLTPIAVGAVLTYSASSQPVFFIFGGAACLALVLWLFLTRETAGKEIDV